MAQTRGGCQRLGEVGGGRDMHYMWGLSVLQRPVRFSLTPTVNLNPYLPSPGPEVDLAPILG